MPKVFYERKFYLRIIQVQNVSFNYLSYLKNFILCFARFLVVKMFISYTLLKVFLEFYEMNNKKMEYFVQFTAKLFTLIFLFSILFAVRSISSF